MAHERAKMHLGMLEHGLRDPVEINRRDEKNKGVDCALLQRALIFPDILGVCKFMGYAELNPEHWAKLYSDSIE